MTMLGPRTTVAGKGTACCGFAWRHRSDLFLGVVVKATYRLQPGAEMVLSAPRAIRCTPAPDLYPSDLIPFRRCADVIVRATPFAPYLLGRGRPDAPQTHLRVDHGPSILIDKRATSPGATAPLLPTGWGKASGAEWDRGVLTLSSDVDWRAFQCAPPDQRTRPLKGGEVLRLTGVDPDRDVVDFRVPALACEAFLAEEDGAGWFPVSLSCDQLALDLESCTAEISWHGSLRVDAALLSRVHLQSVLGDGLRTLDMPPPQPSSEAAEVQGLRLVDYFHTGAPFELTAAGSSRGAPEPTTHPATPWDMDVLADTLSPTSCEQDVPPSATEVSAVVPERWKRRDESPLVEIPQTPKRQPVPNVRAVLYGRFHGGTSR